MICLNLRARQKLHTTRSKRAPGCRQETHILKFYNLIQLHTILSRKQNHARRSLSKHLIAALTYSALTMTGLWAAEPWPTISLRDLPEALKQEWFKLAPDMTPASQCATAFDSTTDPHLMSFDCSIYIKISNEGARRAMRYCETARQRKGIRAPCWLIAH